MAEDLIRYDKLAQDALRGVVRTVLTRVCKSGLPGEHHFYVAFDTQADGVVMSRRLKEQYPEEMTIVLQYQFWDLIVDEARFEVKLSFNNIPERIVIPYSALKGFYDPSVQFGLQFGSPGAANDAARAGGALPDMVREAEEAAPALSSAVPDDEHGEAAHGGDTPASGNGNAAPLPNVVELDAFRKK